MFLPGGEKANGSINNASFAWGRCFNGNRQPWHASQNQEFPCVAIRERYGHEGRELVQKHASCSGDFFELVASFWRVFAGTFYWLIPYSFQPLFFSRTGCVPWVFEGFLKRRIFSGKNEEASLEKYRETHMHTISGGPQIRDGPKSASVKHSSRHVVTSSKGTPRTGLRIDEVILIVEVSFFTPKHCLEKTRFSKAYLEKSGNDELAVWIGGLVLIEGEWETTQPPNHQIKPPSRGNLN